MLIKIKDILRVSAMFEFLKNNRNRALSPTQERLYKINNSQLTQEENIKFLFSGVRPKPFSLNLGKKTLQEMKLGESVVSIDLLNEPKDKTDIIFARFLHYRSGKSFINDKGEREIRPKELIDTLVVYFEFEISNEHYGCFNHVDLKEVDGGYVVVDSDSSSDDVFKLDYSDDAFIDTFTMKINSGNFSNVDPNFITTIEYKKGA